LLNYNRIGIPVKKRDMNAMHPLKGEIVRSEIWGEENPNILILVLV